MPDVGDLSDTYTLNLEVKDGITPAIDATAAKMAGFEDSAAKAAQALAGVGGAMGDTADKITAVDSQWERLSARNDSVTAASNRLAAAQAILADATAAAGRAIALGSETAEGAAPALQTLADKVAVQTAALIQAREATEAATLAQEAWRGAHDATLASITASENAGTISTTQATAAREAETVAFAANIIQANNATAAIKAHGISTGETTFIMRQFSLAGVSAFTGLATGAPIMSVLTQSVTQLGYELTLSRHGFTLLKEGVTEAVEALGGWTVTGVIAGVVALTAALVTLGFETESTAREQNDLSALLSGTRKDYAGLADGVIEASKQIEASTSLTTAQALLMNKALIGVPGVAISQLGDLDRTVLGLSRSMGTGLAQATTLVVTALKDPLKAATDLATAGQVAMTSAILLSVQSMVDEGDKAGAIKLVLATMGQAATTAAAQHTPLQEAMTKLSLAFHTTGADGKSWADTLGGVMTSFATGFIADIANLLNNLRTFRDFLDNLHKNAWSGPSGPAVPQLDADGRPVITPNLQGPFAPATSGGGPISPADTNALPGQIAAASEQNKVSAALITALQHFENVVPNAAGNWNNSPTGPVGAMQVSPTTFGGMQKQPSQFPVTASIGNASLTDQGTNVMVGTEYLAHLLNKYGGDVNLAILAYHDGETKIDAYLAGIKNPALAQVQPSDAALSESANVINRTGLTHVTPPSASSTKQVIDVGGGTATGPGTSTTSDPAQVLAVKNALDAQNQSVANLKLGLKQLTEARDEADKAGDAAGVAKLNTLIDAQNIAIKNAVDPTRQATLAQTDLAKSAGIVGDADRQLAALQIQIASQRAQNPLNPESEQAASAQTAALTANLAAGYQKQATAQDTVIASTDALAAKYADGGRAAAELQAHQDAVNTAMKFFATNSPEFTKAVADQTQRNIELASATDKVAAAKETDNNAASTQVLQTEIATLGQDSDARAALITHMQDEIAVKQQYKTLSEAGIQTMVAERDNLAQLSRAYQTQQDNLSFLSGEFTSAFNTIGNAMAQAFVQGQGAAVNWGNVMKSVIQQVIQKVLELAVLNPILNSLFGGSGGKTLPTLFSVLGSLGSSTGSTVSGVAGSAGALAGTAASGSGISGSAIAGLTGNDLTVAQEGGSVGTVLGALAVGGAAANSNLTPAQQDGSASGGLSFSSLLSGGSSIAKLFGSGNGSISNLFSNFGSTLNSAPQSLLSSLFGTGTGTFGGGGPVANFLATPLIGSVSSEATSSALSALPTVNGLTTAGPETAGEFAAAGGSVPTTIGGALGGFGAGFGAGATVGGLVQGALGKTGPAPLIGAGIGALAGSFFGPVGSLVGGVIGGAAGGLIGPKPPSPFSSTYVGVNDQGQLDIGRSISQLSDTTADRAAATAAINQTNAVMASLGIKIASIADVNGPNRALSVQPGDTQSIQIGQNSPKGPIDPSKFADFTTLFPDLRFTSTATDPKQASEQNTFLTDKSFTDINDLQTTIGAVNAFTADMANVAAPAKGAAFDVASFLTSIKGLADADIPAKLASVDTFVSQTVPSLEKMGTSTGSLQAAVDALNTQFAPAIAQAHALGYQEQQLTDARDKAIAIATKAAQYTTDQADIGAQVSLAQANATLSGDPQDAKNAALFAFDTQAAQQQKTFSDNLIATWGDAFATTQSYTDSMLMEEKTLGAQRLVIAKTADDAILAQEVALTRTDQGFQVRLDQAQQASGSLTPAQITASQLDVFDIGAGQQRADLSKTLTDSLGQAYITTAAFGQQMADLETTLAAERLNIANASNVALAASAKAANDQAAGSAAAFIKSLRSYLDSIAVGASSPLSPKAQLDVAQSTFTTTANAAQGGDANAMGELQSASSTLLAAGKAYYGSGTGYTALFNQVTGAIKGISQMSPDTLTASFLAAQEQTQTEALSSELAKLRADVTTVQTATTSGSIATVKAIAAADGTTITLADQLAHNDNIALGAAIGSVASWISVLTATIVGQNAVYFPALYKTVSALGASFSGGSASVVNQVSADSAWIAGTVAAWGAQNAAWYNILHADLLALNAKSWTISGGGVYTGPVNVSQLTGSWAQSPIGGGGGAGGQSGGWIGMAGGGWVANGTWNRDSVSARHADGSHIMLAGGEFVVNAAVARAHAAELEHMNPGFQGAGRGAAHRAGGGWIGSGMSNDNTPVVAALQMHAMASSVDTRSQTAALVTALAAVQNEIRKLRASMASASGTPGRIAA